MSGAVDALKRSFIDVVLVASSSPLACLAQSTVASTLSGQFKVSPTDAITYSTSLQLHPVPGEIAPKLAITYNFEGADMYLGGKFARGNSLSPTSLAGGCLYQMK